MSESSKYTSVILSWQLIDGYVFHVYRLSLLSTLHGDEATLLLGWTEGAGADVFKARDGEVPLCVRAAPLLERMQVCQSCVRVKGVKNYYINITAKKQKE